MSQYQMQKCLFDYLRAKKHAPPDQKPDVSVEGYDLTDEERKVVETLERGQALCDGHASGDHQQPLPIHGLSAGRLPSIARRVGGGGTREDTMAEIVMAYSAAHAPMQAADPGSAPPEQGER